VEWPNLEVQGLVLREELESESTLGLYWAAEDARLP